MLFTPIPISSVTKNPFSISDNKSVTVLDPASIYTFVAAGLGGPPVPRAAFPVVSKCSCREAERSISHVNNLPSLTNNLGFVAIASPSKGLDNKPRLRSGSSYILIEESNISLPIKSLRKEVPRAIAAPLIAPVK